MPSSGQEYQILDRGLPQFSEFWTFYDCKRFGVFEQKVALNPNTSVFGIFRIPYSIMEGPKKFLEVVKPKF